MVDNTSVKPKFYVYVLYRAYGDKTPCYIGKGTGQRIKQHEKLGSAHYNKHLANVIAKGITSEIVYRSHNELEAFEEELRLIALYGRANIKTGTLCNLTDGGEGHSGYVQSSELRAARSVFMSGNQYGVGNTNRRGKKMSAETIEKLKGNKNGVGGKASRGYRHTAEWKATNAERMKGNKYGKGYKFTPEQIARRTATRQANALLQQIGG